MDKEKTTNEFKGKYYSAVGRRKRSVAQARLYKSGTGEILVNGRKFSQYFPETKYKDFVTQPLKIAGREKEVDLLIIVRGGGKAGQAEAVRHSIARALLSIDKEIKSVLKKEQLLTRDPRKKERKKPGLKKARRSEQWSKR